jgi:lysophospholipase L1-like esterase
VHISSSAHSSGFRCCSDAGRRKIFSALQLLAAVGFWQNPCFAEKIACVGDSITYGYGLSDPGTQSYPSILQGLVGSEHQVSNFGVSGATLLRSGDRPYWQEAQFGASDSFAPDIVVVMLGTNDSKPENWSNKAMFAVDYHDLIDHYRALGAVVYVATPPPVFAQGAFSISPTVVAEEVTPLVEQIATEAQTPLIEVFDALSGQDALFPDTVHPNAEGARLLAETVAAALESNGFAEVGAGGTGGTSGGTGGSDGTSVGTGGTPGAGASSGAGGSGGSAPSTGSGGQTSGGGAPFSGGSTGAGGSLDPMPPDNTQTGSVGNNPQAPDAADGESVPAAKSGCQMRTGRTAPGGAMVLAGLLWFLRRRVRAKV